MKVNKIFIVFAAVAQLILGAIMPAYANTQKDVTVTATLDSMVVLEDAATGLAFTTPPPVGLTWDGSSFTTWSHQVLIATNNHSVGVLMKLASPAALSLNGAGTGTTIPLKVALNDVPITTDGVTLGAANLFGSVGLGPAVSFAEWLRIGADPPETTPASGTWSGTVSIVLSQAT